MMGAEGLKKASQVAILNANYISKKLNKYFPYNSYTDKRYDHLVLMQDLVKAFPPFEITGGAETKKAYWYGTLCGYYACLQNQSDNAIKREAIKEHESAKGTN